MIGLNKHRASAANREKLVQVAQLLAPRAGRARSLIRLASLVYNVERELTHFITVRPTAEAVVRFIRHPGPIFVAVFMAKVHFHPALEKVAGGASRAMHPV